ncbi:HAD family hydrolase [Helcococcus kunzii]|uniref:HAD family hydrolase n=1 Tax=Helcococcus kunzii TaxID=40091 RepID=UPI0024AD4539|nr:HAD family hydrolase [Helcococcus kunzii]
MTKKFIFFDIDDTLYDQLIPFENAIKKNFENINYNIEDLFKLSRKFSDEIFNLTESNQISLEQMHIYRIKKALESKSIYIDDKTALDFQKEYSYNQSNIKLSKEMENILLEILAQDVEIGIISNGPSKHQRAKIKNLGLERFINLDNIFISSEVGVAKPDLKIFKLAEKHLSLNPKNDEIYYIGDSLYNDIIPSKNCKWKSIWIDRRNKSNKNNFEIPDFLVNSEKELYNLIKEEVL